MFVSNVVDPFREGNQRSGDGYRWPPSMDSVPKTAVIVCFDHMAGGPVGFGQGIDVDTPLPLSLQGAHRSVEGWFERAMLKAIRMNGSARFTLWRWTGSQSSPEDQDMAERIVASIAPLPRA